MLSRESVPQLSRGQRWTAEALAIAYMSAIAAVATATGVATLLFPELAAMTHDVLARPWGKWAGQPVRLVVTPVLTAIVGTIVTRRLPYHVLTILLVVCVSLVIIRLLRSAIAPAISAGVLPLALGVKSWLYPPGIAAGLVGLAAMSILWQELVGARELGLLPLPVRRERAGERVHRATFVFRQPTVARQTLTLPSPGVPGEGMETRPSELALSTSASPAADVDDILESAPRGGIAWLIALLSFVAVTGAAAQFTGLRFILFPPLIVIAYEMFGHPDTCPWSKRPMSLPIACGLTALGGIAFVKLLGPGAPAAALGMAWGVVVLRLFDVHMPPALAVGLIPLVMEKPTWVYPGSVTIGTLALTVASLAYNRLMSRTSRTPVARARTGEPCVRPSQG